MVFLESPSSPAPLKEPYIVTPTQESELRRRLSEKDIADIVEAEAVNKLVDEVSKARHAKPRRKLATSFQRFMDYDAGIVAWAREAIRRGDPPAEAFRHLAAARERGEALLGALKH
jgi:hypothetical protein